MLQSIPNVSCEHVKHLVHCVLVGMNLMQSYISLNVYSQLCLSPSCLDILSHCMLGSSHKVTCLVFNLVQLKSPFTSRLPAFLLTLHLSSSVISSFFLPAFLSGAE